MIQIELIYKRSKDREEVEERIDKVLMKSEHQYKVYRVSNEDKRSEYLIKRPGLRICIIEEKGKAEEIVREVREKEEDMTAFIIVIKADKQERYEGLYEISPFNLQVIEKEEIEKVIGSIVRMWDRYTNCITYRYENQIYKIPYKDILYIEKETDSKISKIKCIGKTEYKINKSLKKLEEMLDKNFIKTHKRAIVNIENIKEIDLNSRTIIFRDNERCSYLSRSSKKMIKTMMTE